MNTINMKKLEITTGLIIHDKPVHTVFEGAVISSCHMANGNGEYLCKMYGEDEVQCRANAELTADAFNTYQQCELLPSELLKQNKELRYVLEITAEQLKVFSDMDVTNRETVLHALKQAEQALNSKP